MENNIGTGKEQIVEALKQKACTKQKIYRHTLAVFNQLKEILTEIVNELQDEFKNIDKEVKFDYTDNGTFEAQIKFSGDVLIFSMHTNVFNFEDNHAVHQAKIVEENPMNVYCGMVEVYNFLADSLKYQRLNDSGYLVARIFINQDGHFFVEGERQLGFLYNDFDNMIINDVYLKAIVESAILYAIEFDLWVPSIQEVKEITVQQKIQASGLQTHKTSKRLGFLFKAEEKKLAG